MKINQFPKVTVQDESRRGRHERYMQEIDGHLTSNISRPYTLMISHE